MDESLILSKFDALIKSGLVQYNDKQESIQHIDRRLKFRFLLTSALAKKPTIQTHESKTEENSDSELHHQRRDGSDISTGSYEIGDISNTHFMVANKFSFARPHLLLLTSDGYRRQYEPLHKSDLEAAWAVLTAVDRDYVAFYNCGQDGGCSRLHKHMQAMPMPRDSFAAFLDSKGRKEPSFPFHWFYHLFNSQHVTPENLTEVYIGLLKQASKVGNGRSEHADKIPPGASCPHNMILTKRWMLVIPRQRGAIENNMVGVNALGMLGVIVVATKDEMNAWLRQGPTEALREAGVPKEV